MERDMDGAIIRLFNSRMGALEEQEEEEMGAGCAGGGTLGY